MAHREDNPVGVEMNLRIAGDALGNVDDRADSAASREINRFHRPAATEVSGVDLPGLIHRGFGAVFVVVLRPSHEQDGLAADQRIGNQRFPPQRLDIRVQAARILWRSLRSSLDNRIESGQELWTTRITFAKRGDQVLNGLS